MCSDGSNSSIILTLKHFKSCENDKDAIDECRAELLAFFKKELQTLNSLKEFGAYISNTDLAKIEALDGMIHFVRTVTDVKILKLYLVINMVKETAFVSGTALNNIFGSIDYKVIKYSTNINGEHKTILLGMVEEIYKGHSNASSIIRGDSNATTLKRGLTNNNKTDARKLNDIFSPKKFECKAFYFNWFKTKLIAKGKASRGYRSNTMSWLVQESNKNRFYNFISSVSKQARTRYTKGMYEYDIKNSLFQFLNSRFKLISYDMGDMNNKGFLSYIAKLSKELELKYPSFNTKILLISFINQYFKHNRAYKVDKGLSYAYTYNDEIFDGLKSCLSLIDFSNEEYNKWETETIYRFINHYKLHSILINHDAVYSKVNLDGRLDEFDVEFKQSNKIKDISNYTAIQELQWEIYDVYKVRQRKNLKFETRTRVELKYECLKYKLQLLQGKKN